MNRFEIWHVNCNAGLEMRWQDGERVIMIGHNRWTGRYREGPWTVIAQSTKCGETYWHTGDSRHRGVLPRGRTFTKTGRIDQGQEQQ